MPGTHRMKSPAGNAGMRTEMDVELRSSGLRTFTQWPFTITMAG